MSNGCSQVPYTEGGAQIDIHAPFEDYATENMDHPAKHDYAVGFTTVFYSETDGEYLGEYKKVGIFLRLTKFLRRK